MEQKETYFKIAAARSGIDVERSQIIASEEYILKLEKKAPGKFEYVPAPKFDPKQALVEIYRKQIERQEEKS